MRYIGGDNQTIGQKQERVVRLLRPLPLVNLGWPWQCWCGKTGWTKYRGRFYCWNCGYRMSSVDALVIGRRETFRQAFELVERHAIEAQAEEAA